MATFFGVGILSLIAGMPFHSPETHIVGSSIAVSSLVGAGLAVLELDKRSSPLVLFAPLVAVIYIIFNVFTLAYDQSGGVAWLSRS
jgi:membrane associated rhomboid family serine protease